MDWVKPYGIVVSHDERVARHHEIRGSLGYICRSGLLVEFISQER